MFTSSSRASFAMPSPTRVIAQESSRRLKHASFQQKNYSTAYQILHAYFTQPEPAYVAPAAH